mgnify:CR=1 FL=1
MSKLQGQKVYVVNTFKRSTDEATGYQIFGSRTDAETKVEAINRAERKTGEYAYYDVTTIF